MPLSSRYVFNFFEEISSILFGKNSLLIAREYDKELSEAW
jgi:hypothetical protein